MEFKGNIIITDPCYIIKDWHWDSCIDEDEDTRKMPRRFGPTYIFEDTGIGDGSWTVLREDGKILGNYSVDSGNFCVCDYDKAKIYNPDFDKNLPKDCYTVINDFDGVIVTETDENGEKHIYGKGNITFYTR